MSKSAFGVWTLVALVVGNAVGAGIYTTSGFSLAELGSREWVVLAWIVAGCIAMAGAVSYGMLVQGITESGGEYLFLSRSIHPLAGFIAGWISLLAGFPGAIAFAASAFETYARAALPSFSAVPHDVLAVIVIVCAGAVHIVRVKTGATVHEIVVALMLLILSFIVLWSGFRFLSLDSLPVPSKTGLVAFNAFAFANSLVWISLSYSGFNAAAYVAGEVRNAKSVVPKGMIIGTAITMLLCVAINAIMLYGSDPELLRGQPDIAALAAESMAGSTGRRWVELVIAVSLLTSITAMVLAGPRVYSKMAEDGALPKFFRGQQGQPPRTSIMLQVFTALVLVLVADLRELLSYLGLALSLCLAMAVSSLFVRHWRFSERPSSRLYPVAPMIFVLCTVVFAVMSALNDARQFWAVLPTIAIGVLAYYFSVWQQRRLAKHNR